MEDFDTLLTDGVSAVKVVRLDEAHGGKLEVWSEKCEDKLAENSRFGKFF